MSNTDDDKKGDISDGFHTFNELYDHRHALMLCVMRSNPLRSWYSMLHDDGTMFDDWFIVGFDTGHGMITYHLPDRLLGAVKKSGANQLEKGMPWDGHTASDVVRRLTLFAVREIEDLND